MSPPLAQELLVVDIDVGCSQRDSPLSPGVCPTELASAPKYGLHTHSHG